MSATEVLSPYRGLVPYAEEDAAFFFGRTRDTGVVISNLLASRLTLFYGASGVGKSSVLNAGVVPALRSLASGNSAQVGRPELAVVVFRDWASAPALGLARAVQRECSRAVGESLRNLPAPAGLLAALREGAEKVGGEVLLILDQFEEHFVYAAGDDFESFDDAFVAALNDRALNVNVLLSIREDGLAKLDRFKGRIPNLFGNYLRIEHLDEDSAREAIAKPVERYNEIVRVGRVPITLEHGLVDTVLKEVRAGRVTISDAALGGVASASGGDVRIETPFLQLVMTRLWDFELGRGSEQLRLGTLKDELGGAGSIVRNHVRAALDRLTPEEKRLAVAAFRYLITPSRTKIALPSVDLAAMSEMPAGPLAELLEKLTGSGYRILKPVPPPPDRPDAVGYEIWHDILAQAILDWRNERIQEAQVEAARAEADAELQAAREKARERAAAARRSRRMTLVMSVCLVLSLIGLAYGWLKQQDARQQARRAEWHKQLADARVALSTDPELGLLIASHVLRERTEGGSGRAADAADTLAMALDASRLRSRLDTDKMRSGYVRMDVSQESADRNVTIAVVGKGDQTFLIDRDTARVSRTLPAPAAEVVDMAISPDGTRIALALANETVEIRDVEGGGEPESIASGGPLLTLAWSRDGERLAFATQDGRVVIRDVAEQREERSIRAFAADSYQFVLALDFSPDGNWLLGAGSDNRLLQWSLSEPSPEETVSCFVGHEDDLTVVRFAPSGKVFASGAKDGAVQLWDGERRGSASGCSRTPLRTLVGHFNTVFDIRFSPDGQTVATASADTTVRLWDVNTGKPLLNLLGHTAPVERIAFLYNGEQVISAGWDGSTRTWDVTGYPDVRASRDSSERSSHVLIMTKDGRTVVRDRTTGEVYRQGRFNSANTGAIDQRGESVAISFFDGSTRVYSVDNGEEFAAFRAHAGRITTLDLSADGQRVASGGIDGYARLWDSRSGKKLGEIELRYVVGTMAFSPDDRHLLVGDESGAEVLWELATDRRTTLAGHSQSPDSVAWSGDAQWLATGSQDKTVLIWSLPGGEPAQTLTFPDIVFGVAFSPDSSRLLAVSGPLVHRYDVNGWREIQPALEGHENFVTSAAFSPDGSRIATASWDRTARVWDAETGRQLAAYTHDEPLSDVMFSPAGSALITISEAGRMRFIPLDNAELLEMADARATRKLSPAECKRYLDHDEC